MNGKDFYLDPINVNRLLSALPDQSLEKDIIDLFLATGLRRGELLSLHWGDVDFVKGTIRICPSKSGERFVPMTRNVYDILQRWSTASEANEFVLDECPTAVVTKTCRAWRKAANGLGIPVPSCHDLRHAFAFRLVSSGCSFEIVFHLMGLRSFRNSLAAWAVRPKKTAPSASVMASTKRQRNKK